MRPEGTSKQADSYEYLRRLLERQRRGPISYEEAQDFGSQLVDFYELLVGNGSEASNGG